MKMDIYLARHGRTFWNLEGRIQGRTNIALSELGRSDALKAANCLKEKGVKVIYSSSLARSIETARIISGKIGANFSQCEKLSEIGAGVFEGRETKSLTGEEKLLWYRLWTPPQNSCPVGGESVKQAFNRISLFLDKLLSEQRSWPILLVGHLGTNRLILSRLLDIPISLAEKIKQPSDKIFRILKGNDSTSIFEINCGGSCVSELINIERLFCNENEH